MAERPADCPFYPLLEGCDKPIGNIPKFAYIESSETIRY